MTDAMWVALVTGGTSVIVLLLTWLKGRRKEQVEVEAVERTTEIAERAALSERLGDVTELTKYINELVAAEVERKLAPIRAELEKVRGESHEMNDVVRAHVTQQWLWDQRGRPGALPMLPAPILARLGLGHLAPPNDTI